MIIGIDLGTTNSLAACFQDGRACIIPNRLRKNLTPSVVAVDEKAQRLPGNTAAFIRSAWQRYLNALWEVSGSMTWAVTNSGPKTCPPWSCVP